MQMPAGAEFSTTFNGVPCAIQSTKIQKTWTLLKQHIHMILDYSDGLYHTKRKYSHNIETSQLIRN